MRRRLGLSPVALVACLAPSAACGAERPAPERVALVVLDALHAAHLGCYGDGGRLSPNLDALAERGLVFRRALSNTTWTLPSTASLMTGQLQETHGVVSAAHALPGDAVLLPELFRAEGWRTAAFVQMAYASQTYGFDRGFDEFHYYGFSGGPRREELQADVEAFQQARAGERYFLYVHLRRPHAVYNPFPALLAREDRGCPLAGAARDELAHADTLGEHVLEPDERRHVEHLYRANLASADLKLTALLARAEADPGMLVVVTSDHGEALGQHGYYGHGHRLHAEVVDVPLVLAGPGVRRGEDTGPASTVDLLPTLAELCGLSRTARLALDGVSLAPRVAREVEAEPRPLRLSARYPPRGRTEVGYVLGDLKVVLATDGTVRVHDRRADPGEAAALDAADPARAADVERLLELARALRRAGRGLGAPPGEPLRVPDEVRADLDALGYAEED